MSTPDGIIHDKRARSECILVIIIIFGTNTLVSIRLGLIKLIQKTHKKGGRELHSFFGCSSVTYCWQFAELQVWGKDVCE